WTRKSGWRASICRTRRRDRRSRTGPWFPRPGRSRFFGFHLGIFLAQFFLGKLADQRLGQSILEDDLLGHFDLVEPFGQEALEVGLADRLAGLELDEGHRGLAAIVV